jgi:hypothetical protein
VVALGSWEIIARNAGFVPTIGDDVKAWIATRDRVTPRSTVVLGTSRGQAALDPQVWADEVGGRPALQLAIAGASARPVLEELADLESYRGLVIVDFVPRIEFDATQHRAAGADAYIVAYREALTSPARRAEAHLRAALPSAVFRHQALSPRRVLGAVGRAVAAPESHDGILPAPPYFSVRSDRFMGLDFALVDTASRVSALSGQITAEGRPANPAELQGILDRLRRAVFRIESRGGRVVFVHFPHCGAIAELEERVFPRADYWDRLAAAEIGETVHAADYPSLNRFGCPDGSHLDVRDAEPFTRALARVLRGVRAAATDRP